MGNYTDIPEDLIKEYSKWITYYPETSLSIPLANKIFEYDKFKKLKRLSKKYKIDIELLVDFFSGI